MQPLLKWRRIEKKRLHLTGIWVKIYKKWEKEGEVLPDKETTEQIAELFKGFADTTRVQIMFILQQRECCVNEIAAEVELSQSAISHQLRILKQMHLIKFRREGKNILYSLADDHVQTILNMGLEHVQE